MGPEEGASANEVSFVPAAAPGGQKNSGLEES
jgi:hypothetical protein